VDVSEVRKRLLSTIETARREASARRAAVDRTSRDFERFLNDVAVPMFRQVATVLRAEGLPFQLFTPADSVRLSSDRSREEFIELVLDTARRPATVIGRASVVRGNRVLTTEEALSEDRPVGELTEEDVVAYVQRALPPFLERS
jgi:hypothetical protein